MLGWLHSQVIQAYEVGLDPDERARLRAAVDEHVDELRRPDGTYDVTFVRLDLRANRARATAPKMSPSAPTMRAMMPSVLFVSFLTTVAVTAGLLDDESDDDDASLLLEPESCGRGQVQHRGRMLGLGLTLDRRIDPRSVLAVVVALDHRERQ